MGQVVVTGGAGFLGSHISEALVTRGEEVTVVDNLCTGRLENIAHLRQDPTFRFIQADVSNGIDIPGDIKAVIHAASPASPDDFTRMPLEILQVGSQGTVNALELASRNDARFLLTSTSEVYGEPLVHPQPEGYWGNVNPIGPRSVYDESKRFAEATTTAYHNFKNVNTAISRIFNTFGPRMRPDDGRVVSNFITQALRGAPITIYGDGLQSRSFCYVDDQVAGQLALLDSEVSGPINIGNSAEITMVELAELIIKITNSSSVVTFQSRPVDDPTRRCPDLTQAAATLGWEPKVGLETGLKATAEYFLAVL